MTKFLEAIGLHAMTNREALMEELDALDGDAFEYMVLSRMSNLPETLGSIKCEDCMKQHNGECPSPGDNDPCATPMSEWFSQPCTHDHLIPEVSA